MIIVFNKNTIVGLIIIFLLAGLAFFSYSQLKKEKISPPEESSLEEIPEISSFVADISLINPNENYLLVNPVKKEWLKSEIKVILNQDTEINRMVLPFNPQNPPADTTFELTEEKITIGELRVGDRVLIQTSQNIGNRVEIEDAYLIQVLP